MSKDDKKSDFDPEIDNKDTIAIYFINGILGVAIIGILVFIFIFVLTFPSLNTAFDYTATGQIGDTIGGISAPFIGITGIVLTFLAFYIQYKANQIQFKQFGVQRKEKNREYHESKILYLMQQNRKIVESMTMSNGTVGVECMAKMYDELRFTYQVIRNVYRKNKLSKDEIANIAYIVFFNGIVGSLGRVNRRLLKDVPDLEELISVLRGVRHKNLSDDNITQYNLTTTIKNISRLDFKLFDGHMIRLGQYFRNLFHLLNYTTSIPDNIFSADEKYEIIKSLRSQMSSFEQIIIYFNSLSFYGKPMRDKNFINIYQLIKNIPLPMIEFAGNVRTRYPDIEFEWDEVVDRVNNQDGNFHADTEEI